MQRIRLYWEFYKSTLVLSYALSLAISLLYLPAFFKVFPFAIMLGGPLLSLFYKETYRKNEYYFYDNRGITKISLLLVNLALHIITGICILNIISYVKLA